MTILIFDTETTGLPNFKERYDHPSQPRVVELALIELYDDGEEIKGESWIIKPDGWEVPEEVAKIHGITTGMAEAQGVPMKEVMEIMHEKVMRATRVVAHNFDFDRRLMITERHFCGMFDESQPWGLREKSFCTMKESKEIIKLPPSEKMMASGRYDNKNPSLAEAYRFFTGEDFSDSHRALPDAYACMKVYLAIQRHRLEGQGFKMEDSW